MQSTLESSKTLNSSSIDEKLEQINKIYEKLEGASSLSLKEKEALVSELKELSKAFDNDESLAPLSKTLNENFALILENLDSQFEELTSNKISFSSLEEAQEFLDKSKERSFELGSTSSLDKQNNRINKLLAQEKLKEQDESLNKQLDTFLFNLDKTINFLEEVKISLEEKEEDSTSKTSSYDLNSNKNDFINTQSSKFINKDISYLI